MTTCSICGKPYGSLSAITILPPAYTSITCTTGTSTFIGEPQYCNGIHFTITTTTNTAAPAFPIAFPLLNFSGQFVTANYFREWVEDELIKQLQTEIVEEKSLEWAEVEQQLDAFMATLNGRKQ